MLAFIVIGAVAGIILGLRFNVSIFVPTILLATAAVTLGGIAGKHEPRMIALTLLGAVVSLQIGYIVGCFLRLVASSRQPAPTSTTRSRADREVQIASGWGVGA